MKDSDGLEMAEEKLVGFLSFASISRTEIAALLKAAVASDCESAHFVWSDNSHHVELDIGMAWNEHSHKNSKVLAVNARTEKISVQKNFEYSEGEFCGFQFEMETPRS